MSAAKVLSPHETHVVVEVLSGCVRIEVIPRFERLAVFAGARWWVELLCMFCRGYGKAGLSRGWGAGRCEARLKGPSFW
jgi:hypothetical protein